MIYFESETTLSEKVFTIRFPVNSLNELRWTTKELKQLKDLDSSGTVTDQIKLLAMLAEQVESKYQDHHIITGEQDE